MIICDIYATHIYVYSKHICNALCNTHIVQQTYMQHPMYMYAKHIYMQHTIYMYIYMCNTLLYMYTTHTYIYATHYKYVNIYMQLCKYIYATHHIHVCNTHIYVLHTHICTQVMNHESYGEGVDIWGAGCIGFEMMTLDFLWERYATNTATHCNTLQRIATHCNTMKHNETHLQHIGNTLLGIRKVRAQCACDSVCER